MKNQIIGYGNQGLSLEKNPWLTNEAINAAHMYRGAIIGGWANVETSLIEVAIRSSKHEAYLGHRDAYPSKFKGRIKYLREILELNGPLYAYKNLGHSIIDKYEHSTDIRNMMAHSLMEILPVGGVIFNGYQPRDQLISKISKQYTLEKMKGMAHESTRFSRAIRLLMWRANNMRLLPPLIPPK